MRWILSIALISLSFGCQQPVRQAALSAKPWSEEILLSHQAGFDAYHPTIATVGRHGQVQLLWFESSTPQWNTVYQAEMGLGRIAMQPASQGKPIVLYVTTDDGRVVRLQHQEDLKFTSEIIHSGDQGLRGIATGKLVDDPSAESLVIYGYSKRVELLTRTNSHWQSQTVFVDRDKGHWLTTAELDGRNNTDEIVVCGYSGRVVLLSRSMQSH